MPNLTINGTNFYYDVYGEGKPLVLIGGLTTNHTVWSFMTPQLQKHFKVILPDNRGAGKSTEAKGGSFSVEDMASDIKKLLDHLHIDKAHIVGHSMGGMIAQSLAIKFPSRVDKLILAGSAAKIDFHALCHIKSTIDLLKSNVSLDIILNTVFPWIYADSFLANKEKVQSELDRIIQDPSPQTYEGYANQVAAIEHFNTTEVVTDILSPTLVLAGSDDVLITKKTSKIQLHEKINASFFEVIQDCGHMFHREKPEVFSQLIINFLR